MQSPLTADQCHQLEVTLSPEPSLSAGLGPLLAGDCGVAARELVLRCLAGRLADGLDIRRALLPALADAVRLAGAGVR